MKFLSSKSTFYKLSNLSLNIKNSAEMSSAVGREHARRVCTLYKKILRLHKGLPKEIESLGSQYVKEEFKRHKTAPPQETVIFMTEWVKYCNLLSEQLSAKGIASQKDVGWNMSEEDVEQFNDEQIRQLYELKLEIEKPRLKFE